MRLSALLLNLCVLSLAAFLSVIGARAAVSIVEERSVVAVREDLIDRGYSWTSVLGDGLQVVLEGVAPTEAERFRAIAAAGGIVDASRVIDNLSVTEAERIRAPEFAIEILRNDSGVSLIGLIPASTNLEELTDDIAQAAEGQSVTDLLEVANYPAPSSWYDALDYALRAVEELPRSKISVSADRVRVDAIADSVEQKRTLESRLARNTPDDVRLAIQISAPRPVIAPFTFRFTLDAEGARFQACAIDSPAAGAKIIAAATELGFSGKSPCVEGLGAPSRDWGDAIAMSLNTLGQIGGGTVTVSNTDISLVAQLGTGQGTFDSAVGELENALPAAFALAAELPQRPDESEDGPPQFTATLSPEGLIQLRGKVPDDVLNLTVENYAKARFGADNITMGTRTVQGLPTDWVVRVLAGVEALSQLSNGAVIVEPRTISVRGNTGNENASAEITRLLIDKLGEAADLQIDVTYVRDLDPIARLLSPRECIEQIQTIKDERKILFDPGSADITLDTQPVIEAIAEVLGNCPDLRMEIAGYTDSQGREVMNEALSRDRARAVLEALRARRVSVARFQAIGFGEKDPIADNSTEAGREANRRIEFRLIVPESETELTTLEELEAPSVPEDASSEDDSSE